MSGDPAAGDAVEADQPSASTSPGVPRPFARPTPVGSVRLTPIGRPIPFHGPEVQATSGATQPDPPAAAARAVIDPATSAARPVVQAGPRSAGGPAGQLAATRLPTAPDRRAPVVLDATPESSAADALEWVVRRLRSGALRLPMTVDYGYPPAALAVVLAALHAEERRRTWTAAATANGTDPQTAKAGEDT